MRLWECIVCGWVYDEAKGWPEDGIAPGTRWEDVPDDWLCPDCGVGKEDFDMIDAGPSPNTPHHEEAGAAEDAPVVIIGTGLAGYGVAKEFRKLDSEYPLIIISSDDGRAYSKPMLSTGFTRNSDADALAQADAGAMATQLKASVWTNTRVTRIDTDQQYLQVGDDETRVHYSKLVLASGAEVIRPPLEGDGQELVYSCNDLMDYADFRTAIANLGVKKVAIIGSGLIGCEFTNDLINGGFAVEAVDPLAWCLPTLLPETAGKAVQAALEEKGARFHFGTLATAVKSRAEGGVKVVLNNGDSIDADIVLSAIGVRPRLDLAQATGLATKRGIVVNRQLQTSATNVYALGDGAEVEGHVLFYVAPLMAAAKALAKTLTGTPTEVVYPAMPVTIKTPACPVVVNPPPRDADGEWTITANERNIVAEFRDPQGSLLGFALTGDGTREKLRLQKELPALLP